MRTAITDNIWYDPEVKSYIMLDVTAEIGQQAAQLVDEVELLPKDEYHVSLVATAKLANDPGAVQAIVDDVARLLQNNPTAIAFEGISSARYVCKKDDETTLIAPAVISGLEGLRTVVRRHVPSYELPFSHVTLLKSSNSPYGISLGSTQDLENYCRRL